MKTLKFVNHFKTVKREALPKTFSLGLAWGGCAIRSLFAILSNALKREHPAIRIWTRPFCCFYFLKKNMLQQIFNYFHILNFYCIIYIRLLASFKFSYIFYLNFLENNDLIIVIILSLNKSTVSFFNNLFK